MLDAEVVVVGGGAIGLSVAKHVAEAGHSVVVLEKEALPGQHQSSRNSGVVHAGYNVKPGTQKARYCVAGNQLLRRYCQDNGIGLLPGGIFVVARDPTEEATLAELQRRARGNGVATTLLDPAGLREHEPHATGTQALWARDAASFDAPAYVQRLAHDAQAAGAALRTGVRAVAIEDDATGATVRLHGQPAIRAKVAVNAAGLFADRLAATLCPDMRIIPFRGTYAELVPARRELVRSHIYAAPDLDFPFLGVHLSRRTDGRVTVGPGAMLALGREAYGTWSVRADVRWSLSFPGFYRMLARRDVRSLVRAEVAKSLRLTAVWNEARLLVPGLRPEDLVRSFTGVRAQMVRRDGSFVEDIVVRETRRAVHVLNAVSPGLTCSLPFGAELAQKAMAKLE